MQIDREKNNQDQFSEGWEHMRDRCREIISWRMRMLPYLHAGFAEYQRSGMPPFRTLVMDYPDDPMLANVDDEYMIGDRLLVAPLFAGEPERKVVFPPGEWQDFWTGQAVSDRTHTIPATMPNIPLYVKVGSLIPWAEIAQHTQTAEARQITVRVYGDGHLGWSSPKNLGGLQLRWDSLALWGTFVQDTGSSFDVVGWKKIG